jgi:glucosyl-dolichyl phosphate glucuronosyltransferase
MIAERRTGAARPHVSVVLPTYNRASSLRRAVDSLVAQQAPGIRFEVIVVDNNCNEETKSVLARAKAQWPPEVKFVVEPTPGVSCARNAGIAVAQAPIVAFVDDDCHVAPDWIATICRVFDEHPHVDCIGGKVLPEWEGTPPAWLTREHWAPVALLDFGDALQTIDSGNRLCLLTANLACRREVFDGVGRFRTELQRVGGSIGSMEDYEWLLRFWEAGCEALYVPELRAWTEVPASRMTRAYHRRWHDGHGHYFALANDPAFESSRTGHLFGVPAHAYRAAVRDAWEWIAR